MDTLWNIIRDFFVRFVFGGSDSLGELYNANFFGSMVTFENSEEFYGGYEYTGTFFVNIGTNYNDSITGNGVPANTFINLGDWLSTTATIITLVALFIGITMLTIKLFKFVSNVISMR